MNCKLSLIFASLASILLAGRATAQNLYVAEYGSGSIVEISPGGGQTTFASGLSAPQGLAFDNAGNLYVANAGANDIIKITPNGTQSLFATGFVGPFGLAFDSHGNLYVSSSGA